MASMCRAAPFAAARSAAFRYKPAALPNVLPRVRTLRVASRAVCVALGSVESLMPLHSAIAAARLKSSIALDSYIWSPLSLGLMEDN